jgi:hypothetical protein
MTFNNLVSKLTKLEVGKSQVNVGDMRETLKRIRELLASDEEAFDYFIKKYLKLKVIEEDDQLP